MHSVSHVTISDQYMYSLLSDINVSGESLSPSRMAKYLISNAHKH